MSGKKLKGEELLEAVFQKIYEKSKGLMLRETDYYMNWNICNDCHESCKCGYQFEKIVKINKEDGAIFFALGYRIIRGRGCHKEPKKMKLFIYKAKTEKESSYEELGNVLRKPYSKGAKEVITVENGLPIILKIELPKVIPLKFMKRRIERMTEYEEKLADILSDCLLKTAEEQ